MLIMICWVAPDRTSLVPFDDVIKEGMVGSQLNAGEVVLVIADILTEFQRMAGAIERLSKRTGRSPILFSLCQWGEVSPTSRIMICCLILTTCCTGTTVALGTEDQSDLEGEYTVSLLTHIHPLMCVHRLRETSVRTGDLSWTS